MVAGPSDNRPKQQLPMRQQRYQKVRPEDMSPRSEEKVVVMAPIFGFFGKVDTKVWYSLILLVLMITHISVGAAMFNWLETGERGRNLTWEKIDQRNFLRYFLMSVGTIRPDNQTYDRLTEDDISRMLELYKTRCFKSDNNETDARMWNFWTSFDFSSTIVSTIGYGGMAPRTETGKLFVLVYTIPGMLIMMSYLNIFSTCILIILRKIIKLIRRLSGQKKMPDIVEQGIVLGISLLFLFAYLLIMATLMHLNNPENDSFVQSLYFYVISMTTVGFGDITLIDHTVLALIRVLFVFCIGLVMVSLVFNAIRELAAAYQRRLLLISQNVVSKTLELAKSHKMKNLGAPALTNGDDIN